MNKKASFWNTIRYKFDNLFSKGTIVLIGLLAILTVVLLLIGTIILVISGILPEGVEENFSFFEAFWQNLIHSMDPGTVGGDIGWGYRIIMLVITFSGIFVFSTFIGLLVSGIEQKIESLRKGRSAVIEKNHTVILGWSAKIFTIISELIIANESEKNASIVILSDKDKVEMEDEIRATIPKSKNTRIICRTGSPVILNDIMITSCESAKSIIVLSPEIGDPDSQVLKTILALRTYSQNVKTTFHTVAEIQHKKNLSVAKMVGKEDIELVLSEDLISRITVQTSLQSGLSVVYTELLDFDGDEIYFYNHPSLTGKKFGDVLFMFNNSTVIGINKSNHETILNPDINTTLDTKDELIIVAKDNDTIVLQSPQKDLIAKEKIKQKSEETKEPQHILILGWNNKGESIVKEFSNYLAPKSHIKIITEFELDQNKFTNLPNLQIEVAQQDITDREVLEQLDYNYFSKIIILSNTEIDIQESDAKTLITLLHLRDIEEISGKKLSIVSEMLDIRNRDLAEAAKADDFIVSEKLTSLMLSQVSENKHLNPVLQDIFDSEGNEIYLKPIENYIDITQPVNFYTILESAVQRQELAIGIKLNKYSGNAQKAYGVILNPQKDEMITYSAGDNVIVIAEN